MPDMIQKLITLTRVNADKSVSAYYPKTVAQQVFLDQKGTTLADHVNDTSIHLSATERSRLTATGGANGYALLDANGFVPSSNINPAVLAITTEFATVAAMLASGATASVAGGQLIWVNDASGDTTVDSGWAIYRKKVDTDPASIDYTNLAAGFTKVAEGESLDVVLQWANIQGKPQSAVADIDDAVTKRHTHNNLDTVLENLVDTSTKDPGTGDVTKAGLNFNGAAIAFQSEVSHLALATSANVDTTAAAMQENDLIFVVSNDNFTLPASVATDITPAQPEP